MGTHQPPKLLEKSAFSVAIDRVLTLAFLSSIYLYVLIKYSILRAKSFSSILSVIGRPWSPLTLVLTRVYCLCVSTSSLLTGMTTFGGKNPGPQYFQVSNAGFIALVAFNS